MNKLLIRHLVLEVLAGVAMVTAVLLAIDTFVSLVGEFNDLGGSQYGIPQAVAFVALEVPGTIVTLLPASALIGTLLALGNLAAHGELVVMRATGMSPTQFLVAIGTAGAVLLLIMALLGETLAPRLSDYANEMRTRALHGDVDVDGGGATWLKVGDRILGFHRQGYGREFDGGVLVFDLGPGQTLKTIAHADSAGVDANNNWVLFNYAETRFAGDHVETRREPRVRKAYQLSPDLLELAVVRADRLSTTGLRRYIAYLQANNLDATSYLIAYWQRGANILSVLFMTVLALPFVFGNRRSGSTAGRLLFGLLIGLTYYVVAKMFAQSGEVFNMDPLVVAWAPIAVLALVTTVGLARLQRPG